MEQDEQSTTDDLSVIPPGMTREDFAELMWKSSKAVRVAANMDRWAAAKGAVNVPTGDFL